MTKKLQPHIRLKKKSKTYGCEREKFMKWVCFIFILLLLASCALTEEEIKKRDWYLNYAAYYYDGQRYPQAEEMALKAQEIDPENLKADLMLAFIYHFSGRYRHAETKFGEILDNNPSDVKAHHGMAINYFQQGNQKRKVGTEYEGEPETDFTKALKHFLKASENADSVDWNPVFNYQISLVYIQLGLDHLSFSQRILDLQKRLQNQSTPSSPETPKPAVEDTAQKETSERLLKQVLETADDEGIALENAFERLSQKHLIKGKTQFSLAIRYLETHEQFLTAQMKSLDEELASTNKGTTLSYEQKHEGQQKILDRRAKVVDARTKAVSTIGMLQFRLQQFDEALETLQRIPQFDPNNPTVHLNTGLALIRKAQQEQERIQEALQKGGTDPVTLQTRSDLVAGLFAKAQDELNLYLAKQQVGHPQMILMVKNVLSNLENRNTIPNKVQSNS